MGKLATEVRAAGCPPSTSDGTPDATSRRARAFTLLEVVLAIAIAVGMLTVVMFFYQQAAQLRAQILIETERISATRLLLDRFTAELRAARPGNFNGTTDSIQFSTISLPATSLWLDTGEEIDASFPDSDLVLVSYRLARSSNPGFGLVRDEKSASALPVRDPALGVVSFHGDLPPPPDPPMIKSTPFVRFRYWNGADWLDRWQANRLPYGVEVSLGTEPLPEDLAAEEYPFEVYRRVIYVPGSRVSGNEILLEGVRLEAEPVSEEEVP